MEKQKDEIVTSTPKKSLSDIGYTEAQKKTLENIQESEEVNISGVSGTMEKELGQKILSSIRNALTANPGENAAFREWLLKLHPGDQKPRGRYFRKKSRKHLLVYQDEFLEFSFH